MESSKKSHEFQTNEMPQSSEKGNVVPNSKKYKKDMEESVYNLEYLFEAPDHMSEIANESSHQSIKVEIKNIPISNQHDRTEEIDKCQHSNIKLQVINCASNQYESIQPPTDQFAWDTDETENENGNDVATGQSHRDPASDLLENIRIPSCSGVSNHSINVEIHNMSKGQEIATDLLNSKSANSVVMLDFKIMPASIDESEIIEISDDDKNDIPQGNMFSPKTNKIDVLQNFAQSSGQKNFNNSRNIQNIKKKLFQNNCKRKISKSFADFSAGYNTSKMPNSFEENSNHSFEIKIYNLPQMKKSQQKNKLKKKLKNISSNQKLSLLGPLTLENNSPKIDHKTNNASYPKINLKIYNASSTQIDKSECELKRPIKSAPHIQEYFKPKRMQHFVRYSKEDIKGTDKDMFKKDFAHNIIEIGKDMMQSIQGVIFKSFNNTPSGNDLCESETKTDDTNQQNLHFHSKLGMYNETPNLSENRVLSDPKVGVPKLSNSHDVQTEPFKFNESKRNNDEYVMMKTIKNSNESVQTDLEQSKFPTLFSNCAKSANRLPQIARTNFPSLRQRQQELHLLRVQVEQKRLKMLDLKLAREWEEMQREKIIFEKYFPTTRYQLKTSDDLLDIL